MTYAALVRPLLFRLEPEKAHGLSIDLLKLRQAVPLASLAKRTPIRALGLDFPNVAGMAAGYDKNAEVFPGLMGLGFGHVEVGTLTPKAQPGNPTPRMFRFPKDRAVVNRLGFNNGGVDAAVDRIHKLRRKMPKGGVLGINIGKNRNTEIEQALDDYVVAYRAVAPVADYVTINVSSPNTPGLRSLQSYAFLGELIRTLREIDATKPLAVKLSPDVPLRDLDAIVEVCLEAGAKGIVATNTTTWRPEASASGRERQGGLSGAPLLPLSLRTIRYLGRILPDELSLIGVGGILSGDDASRMLDLGADLVQLYTGLIYRGPALIKEIDQMAAARQDPRWTYGD